MFRKVSLLTGYKEINRFSSYTYQVTTRYNFKEYKYLYFWESGGGREKQSGEYEELSFCSRGLSQFGKPGIQDLGMLVLLSNSV